MINAEVTARAGASDATGAVRGLAGKQSGDGDKSGFSDALSSAGNSARKNDDTVAEGDTDSAPAAAEAVEDTPPTKARGTLDLTARVLFGKAEDGGRSTLSVSDAMGGHAKATTNATPDPDAATPRKNAKPGADGATAIDTTGSDQPNKADKAHKTDRDKVDRTETDLDGSAGADARDAIAAGKETGLKDMLSLLAGGAPVDTSANAAPKPSVQMRERDETRGEKTVGAAAPGRGAQASAAAKASDALDMPEGSDRALVDERTFRLSSGRGGQGLDMTVGTDEQGKVAFETRVGGNGAAENVVVLDSRRFLGFGQSANGAALTAAMADDKTWAAAMTSGTSLGDPLASSTNNVVNTLKLQLNPHDLGSVTATLRLTGETLNVHLTVENHAAYRQLTDDSSGMIESLRSQGFAVDQVTISVASTSQSDTSGQQQGQQSGQSAQQQAAAHDGRQGAGAGREQNQGQPGSMTGESARGTNDPVSDTVAAGNARPDQLYL
ncbi:flagellar hook-length control protein FliK [Neorhizobium sp. NPDC001467]|uniref:flagellar hook-length control protein FliK n=1 Tax=Neorhizobium sp. NPDC001467 TaxID=3390595 RepID=UPI003D08458C